MADRVHIPEYPEDFELIAGEEFAREPAFWLAHLLLTVGDPGDDPERYGVDAAAYEEMVARLGDPDEAWPVLRVPFGGGHTAYAVYANVEDGSNVEFFVRHPAWGRLGHLGRCGVDEAGPGLSWAELVVLAQAGREGDEGLVDRAQRLLLLVPMLGDARTPRAARGVVEEALDRCGVRAEAAGELVTVLLDGEESRWSVGAGGPVPVCSSSFSPRRVPLALGITPPQARALADALGGRG
ncbi:hypothetical protein [Streptomyces sp. NPDC001056]